MIKTAEKKIVLKAIDELGRNVTAADVAAKTGLPILKATTELNAIAAETEGHLQVATTGDIAYKFNSGFQNAYLAKGIQKFWQDVSGTALKWGFFLLRISFGVMLIVSFVLIIVLILLAILALNSQRDDRDRGGGFDFSFDFFDFLILRDLLWWGSYSTYGYGYGGGYPGGYIDYDRPTTRQADKGNFFYNCFSFLFGDGNPNLNLEERKWQYVAQLIKQHKGVVTAEQLAPYTGADPGNEDGVLPVLVRFNGTPQVTETGNIIYQFPDLQVSVARLEMNKLPTYLREFRWEFTNVPAGQLMPVLLLAGFNFFGSLWLLANINPTGPIGALVIALFVYAVLFLAVPAIRYMMQNVLNSGIEKRNEERSDYSVVLQSPSEALLKKLGEASQLKIKEKQISKDDVVYSTERDALEQEFDPGK